MEIMNNTFKIKFISALLLLAMLLVGCDGQGAESTTPPCEHVWADATCSAPKTCTACGATDGEALAHTWVEADYSNPKTCSVCGATEGEKLECPIPDELNLALQMEKIPVATADMTEQELRDLIVQFMYLQINFAYTPDFGDIMDSYGYHIVNLYGSYGYEDSKIPFEEGKYYGGIPYVGNAAGSLYRWLEFYDAESGIMNWEPLIRTKRKNWEAEGRTFPDVGSAYFGNSCAASCVWSYLRVTNKIDSFWTNTWLPKNGFVKIGDYKLSTGDTHGSDTRDICKDNGAAKMYAAYAQIKKADGLVHTGHAMMSIADAVVVRDSNGNIDGGQSYVLIAEQTGGYRNSSKDMLYSPLGNSGLTYRIQGNFSGNVVNGNVKMMKKTFYSLYKDGFLPFTIPELCGQDTVEKTEIGLYNKSNELFTGDTIKASELKTMTMKCNYAISDIHFIIRDSEGNEVFNTMYAKFANNVLTLKTYSMESAFTDNELYQSKGCINLAVFDYAEKGNHTLEITARVSTGELITVYKGNLAE